MTALRTATIALTSFRLAVAGVIIGAAVLTHAPVGARYTAHTCLCAIVAGTATCGSPAVVLGRTGGPTFPSEPAAALAAGCEGWEVHLPRVTP